MLDTLPASSSSTVGLYPEKPRLYEARLHEVTRC